jgi:hypothetical protein
VTGTVGAVPWTRDLDAFASRAVDAVCQCRPALRLLLLLIPPARLSRPSVHETGIFIVRFA